MVKNSNNIINFQQLISEIKKRDLLPEKIEIPEKSKEILLLLYEKLDGPYKAEFKSEIKKLKNSSKTNNNPQICNNIKPPIVISFHPKLSLLNNNVHEALMAAKFAQYMDAIPLWIPYVYDTATHSIAEGGKIRAPTYAFVESEFITLRSASKIHGNIIKTEKSISPQEINKFINQLESHITDILGNLKRHLNPYNFGHSLFDLKLKVMNFNKKKIRKLIEPIKKILDNGRKGTKFLGEYLGKISTDLFHKLGIPLNTAFIEHALPKIVVKVFGEIIKKEEIKKNPALLEDLFVHYDIKSKERTPIQFTGTDFIAYDDNANRRFSGSLEELADAIEDNSVLPTGPALILLFIALGIKYTLGGLHTQEYYPEYIENAKKLLKDTGFNDEMNVIGYGEIRNLDVCNMTDIMATSRILDKIGSRTIVSKGKIEIPKDIVDQINFLAGPELVPLEYSEILKDITEKTKNQKNKIPAFRRELDRFNQFKPLNELKPDELIQKIDLIQKFYKKVKLSEVHPERIKIAVETLLEDSIMRVEKIKENISLDLHFLGGTIERDYKGKNIDGNGDNNGGDNTRNAEDPSENPFQYNYNSFDGNYDEDFDEDSENYNRQEIIFGGQLIRSKRVPTLLEMVIYETPVDLDFQSPLIINNTKTPHFAFIIVPSKNQAGNDSNPDKPFSTYELSDYQEAISVFIKKQIIPAFFK